MTASSLVVTPYFHECVPEINALDYGAVVVSRLCISFSCLVLVLGLWLGGARFLAFCGRGRFGFRRLGVSVCCVGSGVRAGGLRHFGSILSLLMSEFE